MERKDVASALALVLVLDDLARHLRELHPDVRAQTLRGARSLAIGGSGRLARHGLPVVVTVIAATGGHRAGSCPQFIVMAAVGDVVTGRTPDSLTVSKRPGRADRGTARLHSSASRPPRVREQARFMGRLGEHREW